MITPIHIFRTSSFVNSKNEIEELVGLLLSAIEVKKKYNKISLLADSRGAGLIEQLGMPYDKILPLIETAEDDVSIIDTEIIAFQKLVYIQPDFIYINHKLPLQKKVGRKDFVVRGKRKVKKSETIDVYQKKGVEFYFDYEEEDTQLFDVSAFRCNRAQVIGHYFESYFTSLYKNKDVFKSKSEFLEFSKFIQQNYIYKVSEAQGVLDKVKTCHSKRIWRSNKKDNGNLMEYAFMNYPKEFAKLLSVYQKI